MAYLLYFRGEGQGLMQGITEYIVIVEDETLPPVLIEEETAPGFALHSSIEIVDDVSALPCGMALVALLQARPPRNPNKLPTFFGLTVDCRLREFRRARLDEGIESIPFKSEQGRRLLERLVINLLGGY